MTSDDTWYYFPYTVIGMDSLNAAIARADTHRVVWLSYKDITNSASTENQFISSYSSSSAGNEPYLSLLYTLKAPTAFRDSAKSATTIKCDWTDNITGETGFRIKNIDTGLYIDSTAADATTKTISGLKPNVKYRLQVVVKGGTADGQVSNTDSARTWIGTIPKPTTTMVPVVVAPGDTTWSLRKIVLPDTSGTGITAITPIAIQDSITGKYVYALTGSDTMGTAPWWGTYSSFGGANGDTILFGAGNTSAFRILAKNTQ